MGLKIVRLALKTEGLASMLESSVMATRAKHIIVIQEPRQSGQG